MTLQGKGVFGENKWFVDVPPIATIKYIMYHDPENNPIISLDRKNNIILSDIYFIKALIYFAGLKSSEVIRNSRLCRYQHSKIYLSKRDNEALFSDYYSMHSIDGSATDYDIFFLLYFPVTLIFEILKMDMRVFSMGFCLPSVQGRFCKMLSRGFLNLYYQLVNKKNIKIKYRSKKR
jgi:hypothetical protein